MRTNRKTYKWTYGLAVFALALTTMSGLNLGPTASADGGSDLGTSPFDFADAVYRSHGIVPENIVLRVGDASRTGDFVIDNTNTDPNRRNIRTIETTPGTTGSSGLTYANIFGVLNSTSFERNAAGQLTSRGQQAFDTAERFRVFIFPKASNGSVLDPFLPNKRQDNVFDTRDGYFSNDPLGLWVAVWVVYTPKAFTSAGRKELDPIAATNGRDLDGTPILTSPSQLDNLAAKGSHRAAHAPRGRRRLPLGHLPDPRRPARRLHPPRRLHPRREAEQRHARLPGARQQLRLPPAVGRLVRLSRDTARPRPSQTARAGGVGAARGQPLRSFR